MKPLTTYRQHYCDIYQRSIDWQDRIVMGGASIVGAVWLVWIIEGLLNA